MRFRSAGVLIAAAALASCGDPATNDTRGYTKAPLEEPGVTIEAPEPDPMRALGEPILPVAEELPLEDTVAAPAKPAT